MPTQQQKTGSRMNTYIVQHTWESAKSEQVMPVVSAIIEKAKTGNLPKGFELRGVMLSKSEPKAYCTWGAESKTALEDLLKSVNPPTTHTVSEFNPIYGFGGR